MEVSDVTSDAYAQEVYRKTKCLPLVFKEIPEEFRRKARRELNEPDEETTRKYLRRLRRMLAEEGDWNYRDRVLMAFLRVRKFDLKRTCSFLKANNNFYTKHRDIFGDFDKIMEGSQPIMDAQMATPIPYRNKDGCALVVIRMGLWDPDEIPMENVIQIVALIGAAILDYDVTQISGLILLWDVSGMNLKHYVTAVPNMRFFLSVIQANPIRIKAFHVVHTKSLFLKIYPLIRPLLAPKLRERVVLHGKDMSTLHEYLPPEILPEEYGGHLGPCQDYGFFKIIRKAAEQNLRNVARCKD